MTILCLRFIIFNEFVQVAKLTCMYLFDIYISIFQGVMNKKVVKKISIKWKLSSMRYNCTFIQSHFSRLQENFNIVSCKYWIRNYVICRIKLLPNYNLIRDVVSFYLLFHSVRRNLKSGLLILLENRFHGVWNKALAPGKISKNQ